MDNFYLFQQVLNNVVDGDDFHNNLNLMLARLNNDNNEDELDESEEITLNYVFQLANAFNFYGFVSDGVDKNFPSRTPSELREFVDISPNRDAFLNDLFRDFVAKLTAKGFSIGFQNDNVAATRAFIFLAQQQGESNDKR